MNDRRLVTVTGTVDGEVRDLHAADIVASIDELRERENERRKEQCNEELRERES
jgi:hypothetical protein